jgi:aspartate kinase
MSITFLGTAATITTGLAAETGHGFGTPARICSDMHAAPEQSERTVVMKFGGSSVADPDKIRRVARRLVDAHESGARVVGTISAMGKTTDLLLELAREVSPHPHPRELDMLLSTGERTACALVAMAVHDLGQEAVSFTGSQAGILTDSVHTRAKIRQITPVRVLDALAAGKIVLVAGFQGFPRDTMDITTLGRGAGDLTAVALAATLGASCEIYSDVSGVFTADPRIVPGARKLGVVSYEEMLEMAASGARVLALRSVELARAHGVPIHARSTFSTEDGTRVEDVAGLEAPIVSAVTHSEDEVLFTLLGVPDVPGTAATIFEAVAREHVSVDTILQNAVHGAAEISFSVPLEDVSATRRALDAAQETIGSIEIEEIADLGKVSLVGAGMRSHPGVAAQMFRTLANESINLQLISTSPIKISCLVSRSEVERAVTALHAAFFREDAAAENP